MQIKINKYPYHIAFSGTHGTGKTTAANRLYVQIGAKLKAERKMIVVDGAARQVSEFGFPLNQKTTLAAQQIIFSQNLIDYHMTGHQHDVCLHSRSIWDCIAYTIELAARTQPLEERKGSLETYRGMKKIAKTIHYDHIFILDPEGNNYNKQDGLRDTDKKFRTSVHNTLIDILDYEGVEYTLIKDINQWFDELQIVYGKS